MTLDPDRTSLPVPTRYDRRARAYWNLVRARAWIRAFAARLLRTFVELERGFALLGERLNEILSRSRSLLGERLNEILSRFRSPRSTEADDG